MNETDLLADGVAAAMPEVIALVPPAPAAELGRSAVPPSRHRPSRTLSVQMRNTPDDPVPGALRSVSDLLAERLLDALEPAIPRLSVDAPPGLTSGLPAPAGGRMAFLSGGGERRGFAGDEAVPPVAAGGDPTRRRAGENPCRAGSRPPAADRRRRGGRGHVRGPARRRISRTRGGGRDRGAGRAAESDCHHGRDRRGRVQIERHRLTLAEASFAESPDFRGNGLVEAVSGGAVIRTGREAGPVHLTVNVLEDPPDEVDTGWDEVVEVSWTASTGSASINGAEQFREVMPPWPGDYRLRVHAPGRDDPDDIELYELCVWSAPAAPEIVHKRSDGLDRWLPGEPEPPVAPQPEKKYRWIRARDGLGAAATVTVITGTTADEVLRGFNADPADQESLADLTEEFGIEPWVAVLPLESAVLAVEYNGWQGSKKPVLEALSSRGRAASMFWNVNALTRLSLAERGEVLASFEPGIEQAPLPASLVEDVDFTDHFDRVAKGMVVVEHFTGIEVLPRHIERLWSADVAYPIVE